MVNIVMGPEGSGKTKLLIDAISRALKTESGSMVCIEKGHTESSICPLDMTYENAKLFDQVLRSR